jgi:hypothetical protein
MQRLTPQTVCLALGFAMMSISLATAVGFRQRAEAAEDTPAPLLRHVVLFKFKNSVTKEQVAEVVEAFAALPKKIDTIKDFEWGTDVSVEGKAEGFTHGFVVSFADAKARDAYLPHPAHGEFVKLAGPRIEKVLVFDYVSGR